MRLLGIYGASGFGREILPVVRSQLRNSHADCELVFVDDNPPASLVNEHRCLTYNEFIACKATEKSIVLAIANSQVRERLVRRCASDGISFFHVRSANVVVMDEVKIGDGAILCPFVTLTSNIQIGRQFHANIYSYVAHDCMIGDFVTFAPGVKCNGNVHIEDHAYIGTGAILRQGTPGQPLVIGQGAVVGMGAVVTKNVPPGVTVVGNPARPLIKN